MLGSLVCHDLSTKMGDMALDHDAWQRLGQRVQQRRTQLGMTQGEVHAAGGPSVATMRLIEGAMQQNYQRRILGALERALRWEPGSVDTILDGGEPIPATGMPDVPTPLADVEQELRAIAGNTNRSPHVRAMARSVLDQIDAIREANRAEEEALRQAN